ncbi:RNA exonuclease 1 homolog [Enoplosus armatus]|uniref:RNA exonuclease 1 homolog n=1 Tax=Enoplosus armatus TaxID=215367 RepID=UPI0039931280
MFGASHKSSIVDFAGVHNGCPHAVCGAPVNDETNDDCLQELERINKEIETVRHEVEQEQRRLSRYQTVQADSRNSVPNSSVSKSETAGKNIDRGSYGLSSCTNFTKTYSRARKYVVDNSKPRTDLEYDPLSNFSAGLRSSSSSGKEQKVKKGHGLKRARNTVPCDQKKSVTYQAQLSQSPIPEPLDDSNEDGVLIIDIPPSPDKKRVRFQKPADSVAGKSLQDKVEELKEVKTGPILLDSPLLHPVNAETSPPVSTLLVKADTEEVILIVSSSDDEDELNYSEMELSDSDPMEECYRIFMEANGEDKGNEEQPDLSVAAMDVEKPELNVKPQALSGKKRVAHEAKHSEQSVAKSRPQPQVLVPLRGPAVSGFASQPSITSKIQQVQQRASMLTASVKGGQAFVSSSFQRKPETQSGPSPFTQTPENLQPAPVQSAYINYIPVGPAVIEVGNNLHLILPEGTFPLPVTSSSSQPVPTKRKLKQQCEAAKDKVPHDIRQRYINMFTEEFLKTANVNDAFEKALAEERAVYNRSVNKLKYLSIAVNALKRLKNQSAVAAKDENDVNSQRFKGNIPLNLKKFKGNDDLALYESLKDFILTEEKLIESNFPVQHPEKPSCAVLFADIKKGNTDPLKRICCRCGATYSVSQTGKHIRKEECNYHYGKGVKNKVPGGVETRYSCCEGVMGATGCQLFKLHVHDSLSLDGFVSTVPRHPSDTSCPGVYSLDCEMCYTIHGLELSRVTVVNSSLQVVYDTFVKPENEVIDYNTRFSGISEEDVKGNRTSLREVQETLLSFISADTILIGHGLETDLCALKLLHGTVVDTSVVFPHRLGPPHKLTLNNLTAEYLRRIIQESVCGHDTAEDAAACMELMLWKVKEDGKLKK